MPRIDFTKAGACFIVLFLIGITFTGVYAASPPPEVQQAAEEGLARFLATIPAQELAHLGLSTAEDVQAATLGSPYEQFTLTPAAIAAYQPGSALAPLLTSTGSWLFPVTVHGEARTMLTVGMVNGKWEAGDIGGTYLPGALQKAETNLPGFLDQKGVTAAHTTQFVRVFQTYSDFLFVEAQGAEYLLPLMPDPGQLDLAADTLVTPDEIIPQLKDLLGQSGIQDNSTLGGGGMEDNLGTGEIVNPAADQVDASSTKAGGVAGPALAGVDTDADPQSSSTLLLYAGGIVAVLVLIVGGSALAILRKGRRA